jgi:iron complex outermembrane receptor protein
VTGGTINIATVTNAAKATINGVELEQSLRWGPVELGLNYAYTDAGYDKFAIGAANFTNSRFAGAPEHAASGMLRVQIPMAPGRGELFAQVSGNYVSDTVYADASSSFNSVTQMEIPRAVVADHHSFDARVDWESVFNKPVSLGLWVRNFTNEEYFINAQEAFSSIGFVTGVPGDPRTFGVELRYDF